MDIAALQKWADLLFDTGKRNNLVNFKSSRTGSAELLLPDIVTLFRQAEHGASFEVFDPRLAHDDEDEDAAPTSGELLSREQYKDLYAKKIKRGQVLVYNAENKPTRALKALRKRGRTSIEENGVNILYLAFGFMNWREREEDTATLRAPLLLVPISIESETLLSPLRICVMDDEITVNPTFSFKLQNEFGVKLPAFDEEAGIEAYFEHAELLAQKLGWSVSRQCFVGVFSFLKLNMYQDLTANAARIVTAKTVREMMGEVKGGITPSIEEPVGELCSVVDADSSQADAIKMAKAGKSFVLQGPPGTGKSQTITNVIAECLADGKRVLFVSEKLAALNVVFDKLKKADLAEFCLELHSHKVNKKQVIEELCHTLRAGRSVLSDRAQREIDLLGQTEQQLDAYVEELHKVRSVIQKSLFELYGELSAVRHAPNLSYSVVNVRSKGEEHLSRVMELFSQYAAYVPTVGVDYRKNCWYGFDIEDTTYAAKAALGSDLRATRDLCRALEGTSSALKSRYGINMDTLSLAKMTAKLLGLCGESEFLTPKLFVAGAADKALSTVRLLAPLASTARERKRYLDARYDEELYTLKGEHLHKQLTRQFNGFFTRVFSREYRALMKELRLYRRDGSRLSYGEAVADTEALAAYQGALGKFNRQAKSISHLFGAGYTGIDTDFEALQQDLFALCALLGEGADVGELARYSSQKYESEREAFGEQAKVLLALFGACEAAALRVSEKCDEAKCDLAILSLADLEAKLSCCYDTLDSLDEWSAFCKLLGELEELGVKSLVDRAISRGTEADRLGDVFKKAFYAQWIDAVLHDSPLLWTLSRVKHDEAVRQFKEKDSISFEIHKARIRASLCAKRPGLDLIAQGSAVSILLREGEKRRKQKSIRQLLSEIGELVQTLKPCFLMSPLSVSTFLPSDMEFDVVVFDEASQIFPQDAVGAIYRGKQLIVVGDSRQMPPSSFFQATAETDEEAEDESVSDFESILDYCATTLPQCRLKWHYRSRFESLIAFSNRHFYDGELVTFPSALTDAPETGVELDFVGGTFDRVTKTNEKEAERVVDLVFQHIENHPERSLGVVAFSISQQSLIERRLAARRRAHPEKEFFFNSESAEPFFVKNLETVQGDERDTIIFSVAYGQGSDGRLLLNFGPINREGGERRLNVAVTRAKQHVILVSSMRGSDIDLSRTGSVGARLLKEYLTYAEEGIALFEREADSGAFLDREPDCVNEIAEFLSYHGFESDVSLGASSAKIDLAVKRPGEDNYFLAIECDGGAYRRARSTRDRDRLRQSVLEGMGWQYYRIWTTDWFRNKHAEGERLLAAVQAAASPDHSVNDPAARAATFLEKEREQHFAFPTYQMLDVGDVAEHCEGSLLRIIRTVMEVEAPLSEEWILRRLAPLYGREKVTSVVIREYEEEMRDAQRAGIVRRDGFLYVQGREIPMLRVPEEGGAEREIKYIAKEELACGIRELLRQNVSAEKAGLFRLLAKSLGFSRVGEAMEERFNEALLSLSGEVEIEGLMLSLATSEK